MWDSVAKAAGAKITVKAFVRFETGEGIERRKKILRQKLQSRWQVSKNWCFCSLLLKSISSTERILGRKDFFEAKWKGGQYEKSENIRGL